jgi:hypothetical protein
MDGHCFQALLSNHASDLRQLSAAHVEATRSQVAGFQASIECVSSHLSSSIDKLTEAMKSQAGACEALQSSTQQFMLELWRRSEERSRDSRDPSWKHH